MRIAYIDHSYHRHTRSNYEVLPALLLKHGHEVTFFWDEAWTGGPSVPLESVLEHDGIVMFQQCCTTHAARYRELHDNITVVPMLDQFGQHLGPRYRLHHFFEPLQGCKVLSFSLAVHGIALSYGMESLLVRYYPPVSAHPDIPHQGLHGFFWLRHAGQVSWSTIRCLMGDTSFDSFHLHVAPDPDTPQPELPTDEERRRHNITLSSWFADKKDYDAVLDRANIFFAPRAAEGIGQSFLEAFSRGQCVVAPDQGTMNEYILHGHNGLLYDHNHPQPLNFSHTLKLGKAGLHAARQGRTRWRAQEDSIVSFILRPCPVAEPAEDTPTRLSVPPSPQPQPVSWEAVIWSYRLLYNREPESPEAILHHARSDHQRAMVSGILHSEECRRLWNITFTPNHKGGHDHT